METLSAEQLAEEGRSAYQAGDFLGAAALFERGAGLNRAAGNVLMATEMDNNRSVALLQAGQAAAALEASQGSEEVFRDAGERVKQAMALGNQAAALDSLGRLDEAIRLYEQANELLKAEGEKELRSYVLRSLASLQLRTGKQLESLASMQIAIDQQKKASLLDRLYRFLFRRIAPRP